MTKKEFFKRRTSLQCLQIFFNAFVSMSIAKLIFDNIITGLILFQLIQMSSQGVSLIWTTYLTNSRTRSLEWQKRILPYYTKMKYCLVVLNLIYLSIVLTTGFKYLFLMMFIFMFLNPLMGLINGIESRVETIIMDAKHVEDVTYLSSRKGIFTTLSSIAGTGFSSGVLWFTGATVLPLSVCVIIQQGINIIDEIEMSGYIHKYMKELNEYYDTQISELGGKNKYNEVIMSDEINIA